MKTAFVKPLSIVLLSLSISACSLFKTALFDQYTYQQTISLKVESVSLMKKATLPYDRYASETEELLKEMQKMTEYEKHKEYNNITYKMWSLMADEDKNLFAGFVRRWKTQGNLSPVFVAEAAKQVEDAYDLLIRYESKKDKKTKTSIQDYLN